MNIFTLLLFPTHSVIRLDGNNDEVTINDIEFTYIPDGFVIDEEFDLDVIALQTFKNGESNFEILISTSKSDFVVDSEGAEVSEFILLGNIAYNWSTNDHTYINFVYNDILILVSGNISYDELLKVAESIEIKK